MSMPPLKQLHLKAPVGSGHSRRHRKRRSYLFQWQEHELLRLGHLHKVLQDILVGGLEQLAAGVRVSEASDAQAVGGVQLAEEELTAGVPHPVELQQAGGREQGLKRGQLQVEIHQVSLMNGVN